MFPLFGDAGKKSATEAELQEFGERVRARPDEADGPSLALRHPVVEPEGGENLAVGEEMQVDRGREEPDPEELRRRAARRRITVKRPVRPVERREEQRDGGGDDPDREEPP